MTYYNNFEYKIAPCVYNDNDEIALFGDDGWTVIGVFRNEKGEGFYLLKREVKE